MSRAATLKIVTSKARVSADRHADAPQGPEARPVGPPEAPEQVIAPQAPLAADDRDEAQAHEDRRGERRVARAHEAEGRKAEMSEDEHDGGADIDRDAHEADHQGPARTLEGGQEGAQHQVEQEGQHAPLQGADIGARVPRQPRILSDEQQDSLAVPQDDPDRDRHA